jgi:hypothetical protein
MFSSTEQIELLLKSTTWFCDGTFKTVPLLFEQVYIIQCLVGNEGISTQLFPCTNLIDFFLLVYPAVFALTCNRKRKMYEKMINVILQLATDRQTRLMVQNIVSDFEAAWLFAVEKTVRYLVSPNANSHRYNSYKI